MGKKLFSLLLCLCASVGIAFSQNMTVTGTVTSAEDGLPVIGASVFVQGTTNGAVTDAAGKYTLRNVPTGSTLVFSCIGFANQSKAAAQTVNVVLSPDSELLDQVVVTAQGLRRQEKAIGYSTVKIDGEDLTIASKNSVNMDDIESLTVLKGPAATALYGSLGGNGAVIITTRRGANGETHVEFSHTTQMERYYNHLKLQHAYGGGYVRWNRGLVRLEKDQHPRDAVH